MRKPKAVVGTSADGRLQFDRQQFGPWNNGLHAREELLAARDFLFTGKLGLGKTRLMGHVTEFRKQWQGRQ